MAHSIATTNLYCFQHCIKRPLILIILAFLTCLLIFTHRRYYNHNSPESAYAYSHIAGLTRRNISALDYDHLPKRGGSAAKGPLYYYDEQQTYSDTSRNNDEHSYTVDNLMLRIRDLNRIKLSISNELRIIEREKFKLLREKASLVSRNEKLVLQLGRSKNQLKQLELDISANRKRKYEQTCDSNRIAPIVFNPMRSIDMEQVSLDPPSRIHRYNLNQSKTFTHVAQQRERSYTYDLSPCSLTKDFKFYLAEPEPKDQVTVLTDDRRFKIEPSLAREILQTHRYYTPNINEACLVVSLSEVYDTKSVSLDSRRNNLVISLTHGDYVGPPSEAAMASSTFQAGAFRDRFDLILPSIWRPPINYDSIVGSMPPQSPIERKYLASYFGRGESLLSTGHSQASEAPYELSPLEKTLQVIHRNSIDDLFLFIYNCGPDSNTQCYEEKEKMIELATFLIILPGATEKIDDNTSGLVYLALSRGSIPVIVGRERTRLPFDEVIDWRRAAVLVHTARLPEIHFILRSIGAADLYKLKYHGRRIFENYLATAKQILDTTITIMSLERFNYPPPPVQDVRTITHFRDRNLVIDHNCTAAACLEAKTEPTTSLLSSEILGPREKPFSSQFYRRNFSLTLSSGYDLWNNPLYSPFQLFPSSPVDPLPPSEFKFFSVDQGYRPIGDGLGGSGAEFSRALGGDSPDEQYTIVLLTYERELMLMRTLERLKGLPYLNKILVVWNGVKHPPSINMVWPDVGVPIRVVKVEHNSLNNRFIPYDAIETDAILSLDDDSPLRPDEITFAFRVWRQSRDRIVGFPGRYHAWDSAQNSWMYNSNHSCELSMVLTGGAFFHKYYSYMYTYEMPDAIRSIVNKFMNCEDIAMNFLVAHLTRKPPIKVTSRWTFHCAGCANSLSEDDSHFRERHECLNTFASIYGYMPLLSTQHRSDSVLFKTKLPQDKQKCFRFV